MARHCIELEQLVSNSREITGNLMMPGFTAPKLKWVQKHEPDVFSKVEKVLLPKDYLRFKLSGDYASDMSDSAGTMWLDVDKRDWSDALLKATGLGREQMPKLFEGTEVTGLSLGTSGVYFAVSDGFIANPESALHSFCHALPKTWHTMSVILSAASCLDWVANLTGQADVGSMLKDVEQHADPKSKVIFLPYLSGERTPHELRFG